VNVGDEVLVIVGSSVIDGLAASVWAIAVMIVASEGEQETNIPIDNKDNMTFFI